jgi:hypothetical protein
MSIDYEFPVVHEFRGGKVILDQDADPLMRPRFVTYVQVGQSAPRYWEEAPTLVTAAGQAARILKLLREVTEALETPNA